MATQWKDVFANPEDWTDCRPAKQDELLSQSYADFKHANGTMLRLSSKTPEWVHEELETSEHAWPLYSRRAKGEKNEAEAEPEVVEAEAPKSKAKKAKLAPAARGEAAEDEPASSDAEAAPRIVEAEVPKRKAKKARATRSTKEDSIGEDVSKDGAAEAEVAEGEASEAVVAQAAEADAAEAQADAAEAQPSKAKVGGEEAAAEESPAPSVRRQAAARRGVAAKRAAAEDEGLDKQPGQAAVDGGAEVPSRMSSQLRILLWESVVEDEEEWIKQLPLKQEGKLPVDAADYKHRHLHAELWLSDPSMPKHVSDKLRNVPTDDWEATGKQLATESEVLEAVRERRLSRQASRR